MGTEGQTTYIGGNSLNTTSTDEPHKNNGRRYSISFSFFSYFQLIITFIIHLPLVLLQVTLRSPYK